jgi:hypothetical protein
VKKRPQMTAACPVIRQHSLSEQEIGKKTGKSRTSHEDSPLGTASQMLSDRKPEENRRASCYENNPSA